MRARSQYFWMLVISLGLGTPAYAAEVVLTDVVLSGYQLVSSQHIDNDRYRDTYRLLVTNMGPAFAANATGHASFASNDDDHPGYKDHATNNFRLEIFIGDISSGNIVTSKGTFVIDRRSADANVPKRLRWTFRGYPILGAIPPADPGAAGNATVAGIDANDNGVRDDVERYILIQFPTAPERSALFQYSRAMQGVLLSAGASSSAVQGATILMQSLECLESTGNPLTDASMVEATFMNTAARTSAYLAAMGLLAGQSIPAHLPAQYGGLCN